MDFILSDELKNMLKELNRLYDMAYLELKIRVSYIIDNSVRDINLIEHVFDDLLNIPSEKCYKLFLELCNYVLSFDKEMVLEYIEIYNELYGDEEIKKRKK